MKQSKNRLSSFEVDLMEKLRDLEFASAYIQSAIIDNDLSFLPIALGDVARARGMSKLAESTGVHRRTLYKIFNKEGNPSFELISRVVEGLGLEFEVHPKNTKRKKAS